MSTFRDPNISAAVETTQADALRDAMVAELRELTGIRGDRVAEAFRTVPRRLFVLGAMLEEPYAQDTVRTKPDEHDITIRET